VGHFGVTFMLIEGDHPVATRRRRQALLSTRVHAMTSRQRRTHVDLPVLIREQRVRTGIRLGELSSKARRNGDVPWQL
jgi:hypothetical protein